MLRWTDSESAGRVRCNSMILSGKRKSFVDDLSNERGIVSMRVALCYDLLRFILGSIRFVQFGRVTSGFSSSMAMFNCDSFVAWFGLLFFRQVNEG